MSFVIYRGTYHGYLCILLEFKCFREEQEVGSSGLKVMAVLLNAFGLSLMKTSGFFSILSEPVSKSSIEEWTKKVEGKLSFNPKPREYSVIAVDETVVKCGGQPLHAWVGVDARQENPSG
ncbi:hypothetical protein B9Q04_13640 [Candidatus Marsarchaeota G2 archaeon BE_D]|uniref:Uncharacterized protein n=1 Tax=Candidatus Marsarchaeota G2 archaeon BE_D TaxID=1978158 RepID=A0A2R6C7N2_9ARCH|nr:MAG: hypothetical protein B9Q04_13640 [Candidatus Marsarchaeota G2 archaeon BE_D]